MEQAEFYTEQAGSPGLSGHLTGSQWPPGSDNRIMDFLDARLPAHFWSYLSLNPATGCWEWIGSDVRKGHVKTCKVSIDGKQRSAWLWAWDVAYGQLPRKDGILIRQCSGRDCCNPAHYAVGTPSDAMEKARGITRDLKGQRFGWLKVLGYSKRLVVSRGKGGSSRKLWLCGCDCGATKEVREDALLAGEARSCGCNRYKALVRDITGQRFGMLTVIAIDERPESRTISRNKRWLVRCDCGQEKSKTVADLKRAKSCGCATKIVARSTIRMDTGRAVSGYKKLGQSKDPRYGIWSGIKDRCRNAKNSHFQHYGGRGIKVCDRWLGPDGFFNFTADVGPRPPGASIDRIDPNGNYEPGNVRWANQSQQMQNTRTARSRVARVLDDFEDRDPDLVAALKRELLGVS